VRKDAVQELGKRWRVAELQQVVYDQTLDAEIRVQAACTIGDLGLRDEAVRILISLVRDQTLELTIRKRAALPLGAGNFDVPQELLAIGNDPVMDAPMRLVALNIVVLAWSNAWHEHRQDAIDILHVLTLDATLDIPNRCEAIEILGKHVEELHISASDVTIDEEVRLKAAKTLVNMGKTEEAVSALRTLACDLRNQVQVRWKAAQMLGQMGRLEEQQASWLALVHDSNLRWWTRVRAALTFGIGWLTSRR
jgi:HEAT repeat protein